MIISRRSPAPGFTLPEVLITMAIMTIVGIMVVLVLNSGMVLYAKNTAVNSAHQQARAGIDQMLSNLHNSVSIPQLINTNLQPVPELDGNGVPVPAAGISFQTFDGGPFPVVLDAIATERAIVLYCPGYTPPVNARLNIPSHNIELDVVSTVALAGYTKFTLAADLGTAVDISGTGLDGGVGVTYVITAFITARRSYSVVGSELRYYPTNNLANYRVLTRNLVSPAPFTIPILPGGGLQNRYVAAVNLSTVEPNFNQRGYAAVNMFISSLIPFRCRMTNMQ